MGQTTPTLPELKKIIAGLRGAYNGDNQQRIAFIRMAEYFANVVPSDHPYATQILLGLLAFEMQLIEKAPGSSWYNGSKLYDHIKAQLKISKDNPFPHEERLICIARLFEFLPHCKKPITKPVVNDIKSAMRYSIRQQKEAIDRAINRQPSLSALRAKSTTIVPDYVQATANRFFGNSTRKRQAAFLRYIEQTCEALYDDKLDDPDAQKKALDIRLAALLLVSWEIRETYRGNWALFTSPDGGLFSSGSRLYQECKAALNVKDVLTIVPSVKYDLLEKLSQHVLLVDETLANDEFDDKGNQLSLLEVAVRDVPDLNKTYKSMCVKMDEFTTKARTQRNVKSLGERSIAYATTKAAKYGLSIYTAEFVASQTVLPEIGGAFIDTAAGAAGGALLGPPGARAFEFISRKIRKNMIPVVAGAVTGFFVSRASQKIGNSAGYVVAKTADAAVSGVKSVLGFSQEEPDDRFDAEWVGVLLNLPDDVFSAEDKARLAMTQELPQDSEPASASPKSSMH